MGPESSPVDPGAWAGTLDSGLRRGDEGHHGNRVSLRWLLNPCASA